MASSGMLRRLALVRTDVSEELSASIIRVTHRFLLPRLLVTVSVVPSSPTLVTLMKEALGMWALSSAWSAGSKPRRYWERGLFPSSGQEGGRLLSRSVPLRTLTSVTGRALGIPHLKR
jgi:hypothetical protein